MFLCASDLCGRELEGEVSVSCRRYRWACETFGARPRALRGGVVTDTEEGLVAGVAAGAAEEAVCD